jgi:hypothetical protein
MPTNLTQNPIGLATVRATKKGSTDVWTFTVPYIPNTFILKYGKIVPTYDTVVVTPQNGKVEKYVLQHGSLVRV